MDCSPLEKRRWGFRVSPFEIVAHRGAAESAPENTIAAFQRVLQLGADAVELDVCLTSDRVPVVYHYFYLHENTPLPGVVFDYTFEQLRDAPVYCQKNPAVTAGRISALDDILENVRRDDQPGDRD